MCQRLIASTLCWVVFVIFQLTYTVAHSWHCTNTLSHRRPDHGCSCIMSMTCIDWFSPNVCQWSALGEVNCLRFGVKRSVGGEIQIWHLDTVRRVLTIWLQFFCSTLKPDCIHAGWQGQRQSSVIVDMVDWHRRPRCKGMQWVTSLFDLAFHWANSLSDV